MESQELGALAAAAALATAHLLGGRLRFLDRVPRSRWLSAFGGISVAYVFVHLLPELAEGQAAIEGEHGGDGPILDFLEHLVYLLALAGLGVFYGVEQHAVRSRVATRSAGGDDHTDPGSFWLSVASFGTYNVIVGHLLLREEIAEAHAMVLFTVAMGVHFVVNDIGLHDHHKHRYRRFGRWILAAAVLAGWALGVFVELPERELAMVLAFIGGGVVLNVLKEELPREREARFLPFAVAAVAYAAVLQLL